jgi:hypothetical protein
LVEIPRPVGGEDRIDECAEDLVGLRYGRPPQSQYPHDDAPDVGVDDRLGLSMGQALHRRRRVGAEAG